MARTPKKLALLQIASTDLTTIYTAPTSFSATYSVLTLTNLSATPLSVDLYDNDGSADFLIDVVAVPGGIGRDVTVYSFQRTTSNPGDSLKVQANGDTAFNVSLSGSEASI